MWCRDQDPQHQALPTPAHGRQPHSLCPQPVGTRLAGTCASPLLLALLRDALLWQSLGLTGQVSPAGTGRPQRRSRLRSTAVPCGLGSHGRARPHLQSQISGVPSPASGGMKDSDLRRRPTNPTPGQGLCPYPGPHRAPRPRTPWTPGGAEVRSRHLPGAQRQPPLRPETPPAPVTAPPASQQPLPTHGRFAGRAGARPGGPRPPHVRRSSPGTGTQRREELLL